jgi:hypothetical protein
MFGDEHVKIVCDVEFKMLGHCFVSFGDEKNL